MGPSRRVGLLLGGRSSERVISLRSGEAVAAALTRLGHEVVRIDAGADLAAQVAQAAVEVVYIALHGRYGEDGCVQGTLEVLGVPYTGSGVLASAVAMDKFATKRMLRGEPAVRLARDALVHAGDALPDGVGVPFVVKPTVGGSTVGISIVRDMSAWEQARDLAVHECADVLVEEFIAGDELTVTVLDGEALPVVRIVPASGFYDFEAKYNTNSTRYEVPAPIPEATRLAAQASAVCAYRALGCRGLARVDFIAPSDGSEPVMLEVNTIPGMTDHSLAPMAAGAVGISFDDLVQRLLTGARLDG